MYILEKERALGHHQMGPRGEERGKGAENIHEDITAENFPNLGKETDIQVQDT